jgi:hypothetical protein
VVRWVYVRPDQGFMLADRQHAWMASEYQGFIIRKHLTIFLIQANHRLGVLLQVHREQPLRKPMSKIIFGQ